MPHSYLFGESASMDRQGRARRRENNEFCQNRHRGGGEADYRTLHGMKGVVYVNEETLGARKFADFQINGQGRMGKDSAARLK